MSESPARVAHLAYRMSKAIFQDLGPYRLLTTGNP